MLAHYFPVLVFAVIALIIGCVALLAGFLIGKRKPYGEKQSPYECGFEPFNEARLPFDVRFYLVAILFIIFDLETAFVFPWGAAFRHIGWKGFAAMAVFLSVLAVGFVYEWKRGALEWE